jgi:hypothetical protein
VFHKAEKGGESFQFAEEKKAPLSDGNVQIPRATSPRSNPDAIFRKKQDIRETR